MFCASPAAACFIFQPRRFRCFHAARRLPPPAPAAHFVLAAASRAAAVSRRYRGRRRARWLTTDDAAATPRRRQALPLPTLLPPSFSATRPPPHVFDAHYHAAQQYSQAPLMPDYCHANIDIVTISRHLISRHLSLEGSQEYFIFSMIEILRVK